MKRFFKRSALALLVGCALFKSLPVNSQTTNRGLTYDVSSLTLGGPNPSAFFNSNRLALMSALIDTNGIGTNAVLAIYDPIAKKLITTNSVQILNLILSGDLTVQGALSASSPLGLTMITNLVATDAEVAAAYQALNTKLTRIVNLGSTAGAMWQDANGPTNLPLGSVGQILGVVSGPALGFINQGSGSGDVTGPSSSTDRALVLFNGTTGKLLQSQSVLLVNTNGDLEMTGTNVLRIDLGDGQSSPKYLSLMAPPVIAADYSLQMMSNAVQGILAVYAVTPSNLVAKQVTTSSALLNLITDVSGTDKIVGSASPTFTGDPTAPTADPGDADTSIASTAFVQAIVDALKASQLYQATNNALTILTVVTDTGASNLVTLGSLNGANLTNLNGTAISLGTVAAARIDSAIARNASPSLTTPTLTGPIMSDSTLSNSMTFLTVTLAPDASGTNFTIDFAAGPHQVIVATNNVHLLNFNNFPASGFTRPVALTIYASGANRIFSVRAGASGTNVFKQDVFASQFTITNNTALGIGLESRLIASVMTNVAVMGLTLY